MLCLKFTLTYNNLINYIYIYYTLNYNFCQTYITEWMNLGFLHIIDKNRSFNLFSIFCLYIVYFLSLERCLHSCKAIYTTIDYISLETHWFFVFTIFYTMKRSRTFFVRLLGRSIFSYLYPSFYCLQNLFILYHIFTFLSTTFGLTKSLYTTILR